MIIGYARVSTGDQNTAAQLPALKRAKCKRIYEEVVSGRTMDRPQLEQCLDRLESGDTLVVWRLDRLARSLRDLLEIMDRLDKSGVHFRSITEKFDTTSAMGRMVFHFFAALTQFERELISERTKLGLEAARARGRHGGRKPKLKPQQIRQVKILWASQKVSRKAIAEQFNVSISTIERIVRPKSLKA
jgi:DNA invertase Pin-like site-specific DNA recombinase